MTDDEALEMQINRLAFLTTASAFCNNKIITNDEGEKKSIKEFIDMLRGKAKELEIKLKQDGRLK